MNTCLLILNLILTIIIAYNISCSKFKYDTEERQKIKHFKPLSFINNRDDYWDDENDYDDNEDADNDITEVKSTGNRLEKLREKWEEEDMEKSKIPNYITFKDVHEFMDYVSDYNLKIIDTVINKVRRVRYLDNATCYNDETCRYEKTVKITFDDNTNVIFTPNRFARVNK